MNDSYPLDTEEFAKANGVLPQSVRARVCRFGSYFGVIPKKLANGRLMWPSVQVETHTGQNRKVG